MRPMTYQKDRHGHISVGGVPLKDLADQFGSPLYVLDYATLVTRMDRYQQALRSLNPAGWVAYAGKAFLCRAMVELTRERGLALDVVSGGELYTALKSHFPPERIFYHGNVKTEAEIRLALTAGVGHIVVDSFDELTRVNQLAGERAHKAPILLRLTPGIDAHTHDFIRTGQFDSKFGFGMADGIADEAVRRSLAAEYIDLRGFHAHIGSQILETDPFVANADTLIGFSRHWYDKAGYWPNVLDIGGGLGVQYQGDEIVPELDGIVGQIKRVLERLTPPGCDTPRIVMEPGRSIVAEAGATLYTVEAVKRVPGGKRYVAVDGGMGDNIRPALYQASYQAELDGKNGGAGAEVATVAGRYCESGDILIPEVPLAYPKAGDRLVVWATGAYNYSMASLYNRVPRPPVLLVDDGHVEVWVERETWEDVMRLDRPLNLRPRVRLDG